MVILPGAWHEVVGERRRLDIPARSVGELLGELVRRFPSLAGWLDNGMGQLPDFVHVFVGGEDIRIRQGMETPLAPDDEVHVVVVMAGG